MGRDCGNSNNLCFVIGHDNRNLELLHVDGIAIWRNDSGEFGESGGATVSV